MSESRYCRTKKHSMFPSYQKLVGDFQMQGQTPLQKQLRALREHISKELMSRFQYSDYVFGAQKIFESRKTFLQQRRLTRIVKAVNNIGLQIKDIKSRSLNTIPSSRIQFFSDALHNQKSLTFPVINEDTGVLVVKLKRPVKNDAIFVKSRVEGLKLERRRIEVR